MTQSEARGRHRNHITTLEPETRRGCHRRPRHVGAHAEPGGRSDRSAGTQLRAKLVHRHSKRPDPKHHRSNRQPDLHWTRQSADANPRRQRNRHRHNRFRASRAVNAIGAGSALRFGSRSAGKLPRRQRRQLPGHNDAGGFYSKTSQAHGRLEYTDQAGTGGGLTQAPGRCASQRARTSESPEPRRSCQCGNSADQPRARNRSDRRCGNSTGRPRSTRIRGPCPHRSHPFHNCPPQ